MLVNACSLRTGYSSFETNQPVERRVGAMLLIEQKAVASAVLLNLKGALCAPDGERLTRAVQQTVRTGFRQVVLDLEHVTDLDAAGLGALVTARNLLDNVGGRIALLKPGRYVTHMLAITRLLSIFDVVSPDVLARDPGSGATLQAGTSC
jgi:anti-anti-sigma factor